VAKDIATKETSYNKKQLIGYQITGDLGRNIVSTSYWTPPIGQCHNQGLQN